MKVKNEAEWLRQKAELARNDDPEIGEQFLTLLDEWTARAERFLDLYDDNAQCAPVELKALRETLSAIEQNHGALSGLWIFEMLLVMDAYWIHGGDLYDGLTAFEKAALGDVARAIQRGLQQDAETVPSGPES